MCQEEQQKVLECRLCKSCSTHLFHTNKVHTYYHCTNCQCVFVPSDEVLTYEQEKSIYDLHRNIITDIGYVRFLHRAINPLATYLEECQKTSDRTIKWKGLDFGCGPTPVLAELLEQTPYLYNMEIYDKIYFPDNTKWREQWMIYDFVTSTEVVEHLIEPMDVLRALWWSLAVNGILVIMTKRVEGSLSKFVNWHYIRDPTHITFYHIDSFEWIRKELEQKCNYVCDLRIHGPDVISLTKLACGNSPEENCIIHNSVKKK